MIKIFRESGEFLCEKDKVESNRSLEWLCIKNIHSWQQQLRRRVWVLNRAACSPDLSPIANIWHILNWKIRQRRPSAAEHLESYIKQERGDIPPPKLQQLDPSVPSLHTVVKRKPTFLRLVYFFLKFSQFKLSWKTNVFMRFANHCKHFFKYRFYSALQLYSKLVH